MNKTDIKITVLLGRGECQDTVYTSYLSYYYVNINAEYRT
jgi:N-acetylglutamate synthase/N-acetylornithine aminotransferase